MKVIDPMRLRVNPDCGLKTRGWAETSCGLGAHGGGGGVLRARYRQGSYDHPVRQRNRMSGALPWWLTSAA